MGLATAKAFGEARAAVAVAEFKEDAVKADRRRSSRRDTKRIVNNASHEY
jgi:hypothetical protein